MSQSFVGIFKDICVFITFSVVIISMRKYLPTFTYDLSLYKLNKTVKTVLTGACNAGLTCPCKISINFERSVWSTEWFPRLAPSLKSEYVH